MSRSTLDRSLVHGLAWTGATKWATQLVTWAASLLVVRWLAPSAYGLVGMALVFIGFMQLVNEFGLGAAVVRQRDLTEQQIAQVGGLALLVGCALCALSAGVAGWIAVFFNSPPVRAIVLAFGLQFPIGALQVLPRSLLQRDLNFRRVALTDGVEPVVTAGVTLTLAALGYGYWALVFGPLAGRVVSTTLFWSWRPHRIAWPGRIGTIAGAVTFGWQIVVARVAWYAYSNADFAVVGRVLGNTALGVYTIGWTIGSIPVERISSLLAGVAPGVLSAVQHDQAALRRYMVRITEGLSLITFPAAVGIALIADLFVDVVLGSQWHPAIWPLRILALSAALRSISALPSQIAIATGHSKRNMQLSLMASLMLPGLFYLATRWGPAGVATVWLLGHPLLVMPWFLGYAWHLTGMRASAYARALGPATGATAVMALAVLAVRALTPPQSTGAALQLALAVATGSVVYGAIVYVRYRDRVRGLWRLLRPGRDGASSVQHAESRQGLDEEGSRIAPAPDLLPLSLRGATEETP